MFNKPKMKMIPKGTRGITEEEFNAWWKELMTNSALAYTLSDDPFNCFYGTKSKFSNPELMKHEAILIKIRQIRK